MWVIVKRGIEMPQEKTSKPLLWVSRPTEGKWIPEARTTDRVSRPWASAVCSRGKGTFLSQVPIVLHTGITSELSVASNRTKPRKSCSLLMPRAPVCTEHQWPLCHPPKAMPSPHTSSGVHASSNGCYNEVSPSSSLFVLTTASNGKWL